MMCKPCRLVVAGINARAKYAAIFEERARIVHNNAYTYENAVYVSATTPVAITCPTHGDFEQIPHSHLSGKGCKKCANIVSANKRKSSTAYFITKATDIHLGEYTYLNTMYTRTEEPVVITCKIHGDFTQKARDHLSGRGCQTCAQANRIAKQTDTLATFIEKAQLIHRNGEYSYDSTIYTSSADKLNILCNKHNGVFLQSARDHLQGRGCPTCATSGFDRCKPAILYFGSILGVYKLGVTNRTVRERYNALDYSKFTNILTWEFETGYEAHEREQYLLEYYKQYAYTGPTPFTDGTKTTECFTEDIYKLWEKENGQ